MGRRIEMVLIAYYFRGCAAVAGRRPMSAFLLSIDVVDAPEPAARAHFDTVIDRFSASLCVECLRVCDYILILLFENDRF